MGNQIAKIGNLLFMFFVLCNHWLTAQEYLEISLGGSIDGSGVQIRVYLPENPNGGAVIVCPGGGYRFLEMDKEGYAYAPWFNERGIACIVLKYRLPDGKSGIPLIDAEQAIRLVRDYAKEWNINPGKVGIMGSSAGGHVASTLATHFAADTRPDFQILLYPVITMNPLLMHKGSSEELLGKRAKKELIKHYSNEKWVTEETPMAFIALSDDDNIVSSVNSIGYYLALKKHHVPCELHIYPTGGHGWGMNKNFLYYNQLTTSLELWLQNLLSSEKK